MALETAAEPWAPRRSSDPARAAIEWHATDLLGAYLASFPSGTVMLRRLLDPVQYRFEVRGPDGEVVHTLHESPTSVTELGPIARVWRLAEAQVEAPIIATIDRIREEVLDRVERQRG